MKSCKLLLSILLIAGLASVAMAMDKDEALHGPTTFVPSTNSSAITGGDCTDPIVISSLPFSATAQTNCGYGNTYSATCLGNYDGGEDIIYRLDLAADATIDIVMNPGTTGWTGILLDSACPPNATTCIATNTGSSGTRSILGKTLAAGSYYIMVDTWPTPNCVPSFSLDITAATPPPPPAVNDVCSGAIDIQAQGLSSWEVDLTNAGTYYNDYSLVTPSCTGYTTPGPDAIYKIDMAAGETLTVDENGTCDVALWIATDCDNLLASCVAGADATTSGSEVVTFEATVAGTYYVVIDAYTAAGCPVTVTVNAPVSAETESFGALKAMFR
ncbi:MAG: PPC domain-containing protein [bacterium]|nr:PPC domain-containing protein [bacterium]